MLLSRIILKPSRRLCLRGSAASLLLPLLMLCSGCFHRDFAVAGTYRLEENSGYPLLVPSLGLKQRVDRDYETSAIVLRGPKQKVDFAQPRGCSITGDVFSFSPDMSSSLNQWIVRSPTARGWEKRASEIDVNVEWRGFTSDLLTLQRQGCFAPEQSLFAIQRSIAEAIPLPASEMLLFYYAFSTSGFVDLAPGMQVKIETIVLDSGDLRQIAEHQQASVIAQYEVIPSAQMGVALHLSRTSGRTHGKLFGPETDQMFDLSARFAREPLLRIFLQTVTHKNTQQSPMLLGSAKLRDLNDMTRWIERDGTEGCSAKYPETECVVFSEGTVSLLSAIRVNGRRLYYPLGTHLGNLIETLPSSDQARALQTVSLQRPLSTRGYAKVFFPRTLINAQKIILLAGDRVTWRL